MTEASENDLVVAVNAVGEDGERVVLGEGPVWSSSQGVLWWVDIRAKKLHRYDPTTARDTQYNTHSMPGSVVPRAKGGAVLAMQDGFYFFDPDNGGKWTPITDPESDKPQNRFNDGACDPRGRFVAGTLQIAEKDPNQGAVYSLDPNTLEARKLFDGCTISNGVVWSLDGNTMYYIDTPTYQIDAFDYDLETGTVSNRRTVITVPRIMGFPDGMTIDSEGKLWVCHWGGYCVSRWNPSNGYLLSSVRLPVSKVTSCAFGGPNLEHLYISTASVDCDTTKEPLAGSLFVLRNPGVRGRPEPEFAG